jgi:hypothetical protein
MRIVDPGSHVTDTRLDGGKAVRRPQVPPDLRAVFDQLQIDQDVDRAAEIAPAVETGRKAGTRHVVEDGGPVGGKAGIGTLPKGRGGRERQQVRQEVGHLIGEIDPHLGVFDTDMDVHAADQHPPRDAVHVAGEVAVAILPRHALVLPIGERVAAGRDRDEAVILRHLEDTEPQVRQVGPRLGHVGADGGAHLHLAPQEFR